MIALPGQHGLERSRPATADSQIGVIVDRLREGLALRGATLAHLVKLVVFHVPERLPEPVLRAALGRALDPGTRTTLMVVPLPTLGRPEPAVAIDAYALCDEPRTRTSFVRPGSRPPGRRFCDGLRCGDLVLVGGQSASDGAGATRHPGDLVSQNRIAIEALGEVLDGLEADASDVVKLNTWRGPPPSAEHYARAARERFDTLRDAAPAVTGITVPAAPDGCLIRVDAWAMRAADGARLSRARLRPDGHWGWPAPTPYSHGVRCGDWVLVGGQVALDPDGRVVQPGHVSVQRRLALAHVARVLREAGATLDDLVKVNSYCAGRADQGPLPLPGVAQTIVPVDELAYAGLTIEVEAIARCAAAPRASAG